MKRIIDFIVPIYGKEPKEVYDSLQKLTKMNPSSKIGFILIYKNSSDDKLNYDELTKLSNNDNVKVFKVSSDKKKTYKLIKGIQESDSNFVMPLDSHHSLTFKNVEKILKKLEKFKDNSVDLIWHKPLWVNSDKKSNKNGPAGLNYSFSAGRYILARKAIEDIVYSNIYDIIYADDHTFGLFASSQKKLKTKKISDRMYIRNYGVKNSSTHFWFNETIEKQKEILGDFLKIFDFFINIEKPEIYSKKDFEKTMYNTSKLIVQVASNINGFDRYNATPEQTAITFINIFNENAEEMAKLINEYRNEVYWNLQYMRYWLMNDKFLDRTLKEIKKLREKN